MHLRTAHASKRIVYQQTFAGELSKQAAAGRKQTLQTFRRQTGTMLGSDKAAHAVGF
jgi:hypothetical protein